MKFKAENGTEWEHVLDTVTGNKIIIERLPDPNPMPELDEGDWFLRIAQQRQEDYTEIFNELSGRP